ncbi:MAG: hypothetical protein JSU86_02310 [Phycisphaerales bacterium]|nr:MAG: hypothetical protein JSU86_02310 [Phycisphaerales bacterium]
MASLRDGQSRVYAKADGLPTDGVLFVGRYEDGKIWANTRLVRLDGEGLGTRQADAGGSPGQVFAGLRDRRGEVCVGGSGGLLRVRENAGGSSGERLGFAFGRTLDADTRRGVLALLEDRDGNLWVGTDGTGLLRLRRSLAVRLRHGDGAIRPGTPAITGDGEGGLFVAYKRADAIRRVQARMFSEAFMGDNETRIRHPNAVRRLEAVALSRLACVGTGPHTYGTCAERSYIRGRYPGFASVAEGLAKPASVPVQACALAPERECHTQDPIDVLNPGAGRQVDGF